MIPLQGPPIAFNSAGAGVVFLLGRLLIGGVLAFMGLNHLLNKESMVGYAESKGVPAAGFLIPFTGGQLLLGGLGVAFGIFPVLSAGALATFLIVATPKMHNFWAAPEEQKQNEMNSFLKNVGLLGGTLVLLALGTTPWPYAVGIGLF